MFTIYKLTGAGNSFLFIDLRKFSSSKHFKSHRSKWAKFLCNGDFSIGADGLLFLEPSTCADVKWDFYNADGSKAEMCGNAARCVGGYLSLHDKIKINRSFTMETRVGIVNITPLKVRFAHEHVTVAVDLPFHPSIAPDLHFSYGRKKIYYDFVNSGVPHVVINSATGTNFLKDLHKNVDKYVEIVNKVRSLAQFKQKGVNVTFFSAKNSKEIYSLTFERGVQGYTLACGTGAIAAAASYLLGDYGKIKVQVPGGLLQVQINSTGARLIGPAQQLGEIKLMLNPKSKPPKIKLSPI